MTKIRKSFKQIQKVTQELLRNSLLESYNFPIQKNTELIWQDYSGIYYQLKQDEYNSIYDRINTDSNYNFVFLDGAIIQMMYTFSACWKYLLSHRLAFYPKITNVQFWENPRCFEEENYGLRSFSDLNYMDNITAPLRFDYDNDSGKFIEKDHSYSHLTLAWYKNCRITVNAPLTPFQFMRFILKSFYFEKSKELDLLHTFQDNFVFDETITSLEKEDIHVNFSKT